MKEDDNVRKFFSLLDGGQEKYFNDIAEIYGENIKTVSEFYKFYERMYLQFVSYTYAEKIKMK